jgi:hypothetical protein
VPSLLDRLAAIDPRLIYIVMFLAVFVPIVFPIGLRVTVSPPTQAAFDAIESLPEGSRVLVSFDYGPSTAAENDPMAAAILRHCLARDLKVVTIALYPIGGGSVALGAMQQLAREFPAKKDGTDYVNLGYKDGAQAAMKLMGANFAQVFPVDASGRRFETIPIMQGVTAYKDFGLVVTLPTGIIGEWWANLVNAQFHVPVVIGPTAVSAPKYFAYLNSGNAVGMIGGLKGASEYEKLLIEHYPEMTPYYSKPDVYTATKGMDAQNIAHLTIVFFILIGNFFYILQRRRRRTGALA